MSSFPLIENMTLSSSNISTEIYPLIHSIRPDWTLSNTRLVTFTEGLTNTMLGLFDNRTANDDGSRTLVIKLYGAQTELFIDRRAEIEAMGLFSKERVFSQRVLIQFNNGIIYDYAPGRACSQDDVRREDIARLIAMKLAQCHNLPITKPAEPYVILLCRRFLQLLHGSSFDLFTMKSDVDIIEKNLLSKLVSHAQFSKDLVLCHNDLLVKNIIYHEQTHTVSFIDFEYTHVNYALFDIANHFVEYADVDNLDYSFYPPRAEQKRWLEIYFQARSMPEEIIDDSLCHRIEQFSALVHLMWGLWGLVQSQVSHLDFDYIAYAKARLDHYRKLRSLLFE